MIKMKASFRTMLMFVALLVVLATVLAACSNSSNEKKEDQSAAPAESTATNSTPAASKEPEKPAEPKPIVELKAYFPGDTPKGFEAVQAAVNEKLAKDDMGIKINTQFIPWSDYVTSTSLKLTAGEKFDMYLDAPWAHINQMIASNAIIPLDDYVKNAPNLLKEIPDTMWENNKFSGKIYGIPNGNTQGYIRGVMIRGDLREKYGMEPITTLDKLNEYLYLVKENEPDMIPYGVDGRNANFIASKFNPTLGDGQYHGMESGVRLININGDGKMVPLWEFDGQKEAWETATQLYKDGIIETNVMMQQSIAQLFNQGKVAAVHWQADAVAGLLYVDALKLPGVKLEIVVINEGKGTTSDFKQGNFTSVPATSEHPELVVAFLDWLSIKENHDLLQYGIPGKDWEPVGDDSYKVLSEYVFPGFVVSWRQGLERVPDRMIEDDKKWFKFAQDGANFIKADIANFTIDTTDIKSEVAKLAPLNDSLIKPMSAGVLPYEEGIKKLMEEAKNAGIDKVLEEAQKQFDAFKAAQ